MVSIARRNLFAEKGRVIISVGGVAFAIALILVLWGLFRGWRGALTAYTGGVPVDVWVIQANSRPDIFHSMSLLPMDTRAKLEALPNVAEVHPFLGRAVIAEWKGENLTTYLVGYDPSSSPAGPRRVVEGQAAPKAGQIIIDRVMAENNGIRIGDRLSIGGRTFEVVGIAAGANAFIYQFSFVTDGDAAQVLALENLANYFLVRLKPGTDPIQGAAAIQDALPGIRAFESQDFSVRSASLIMDTFLPIILVLLLIGVGVGTVVIGLTIYTATMEKSREYGVLKALGATNARLYGVVLEQALIASVLGYAAGVALALLISVVAGRLVPVFVTSVGPLEVAGALGLAILMGAAASYFPVRRLVRLDPALVFRS